MEKKIFCLIATIALCMTTIACTPKPKEIVLNYWSIDQHGDSILLSGLVSIPDSSRTIQGVILIPHFTIGANREAPSQKIIVEAKRFKNDFICIMPDYIGYGVSADRFPPYLHGELTAQNCVDMVLETQKILAARNITPTSDSIYIVGFSQGAATAVWTLKTIEQQYTDQIKVKACYAAGGPYDVAAIYDAAVQKDRVGAAMTIPLLVMGTSEAYDLNLDRNYFFTYQMNRRFDELIASKRYGYASLYFLLMSHRVSRWLTPAGADKTLHETAKLYQGLQKSSIVNYDWKPRTTCYIMHSTTDGIVPFVAAEKLRHHWGNLTNVTYDFNDYGDHLICRLKFEKKVASQIVKK